MGRGLMRLGLFSGYRRRRLAPWLAAFAVLTAVEVAIALPLLIGPSGDREGSADGVARGVLSAAGNEEPSAQAGAAADRGRAALGKRRADAPAPQEESSRALPFTGGEDSSVEIEVSDSGEDVVAAAAPASAEPPEGAEGDASSSQGGAERRIPPPKPRPAAPLRRDPPPTTTSAPPAPPASLPPPTTTAITTTTTTTPIAEPPPTTTSPDPPGKCKKRCRGRGGGDDDDDG